MHIALIDESGENPALDVIHLYNEFDLTYLFNISNQEMQTPLHLACIYNKSQCIAKMLQFGNLVFWLSCGICLKTVFVLILVGANPNKVDNAGNTPLHIAVSENAIQCVAELVNQTNYTTKSHALLIDIQNDDGMSSLHMAIRKNNLEIVQMIEAAGASLKLLEPKQGDSVLHMAVQQNSADLVQHLLANSHIDVTQKNTSNYTALGLALGADPMEPNIVQMLKIKEEDISSNSVHFQSNDTQSFDRTPPTIDIHNPNTQHPTSHTPLFDQICIDELCEIFNYNEQWMRLALAFQCQPDRLAKWRTSPDPASQVLQFIASQRIELHQFVNVLMDLDVRNALSCLDDMIARRMENFV